MKIGILLTGTLPEVIVARGGEYDAYFKRLLLSVDPELELFTVDVVNGEALPAPQSADGWLITGSRHGVYDDLPWLEPLKAFCKSAIAAGVPVVGVCFGHQLLAEALGGRAVKSDKGWALGVHSYQPGATPEWLPEGLRRAWSGHVVHQDQVVALPEGATVLASSDFCPYAALAYGDPERPDALSVQPHPEYTNELFNMVSEHRLSATVPAEERAAAAATLDIPVASRDWAEAMVRYFRRMNAAA
ncbi:type 1 glutamine amidotransferase [Oceanibium sediminis]|uniref:type 1 glutamine amidotransferase n=1 Tax=Oceanibium sediminis TaxID=2026339 RepID=UPI000DD4C073|nr:type 1 glutamine amidotransferase [Oceanibium sediminis]